MGLKQSKKKSSTLSSKKKLPAIRGVANIQNKSPTVNIPIPHYNIPRDSLTIPNYNTPSPPIPIPNLQSNKHEKYPKSMSPYECSSPLDDLEEYPSFHEIISGPSATLWLED